MPSLGCVDLPMLSTFDPASTADWNLLRDDMEYAKNNNTTHIAAMERGYAMSFT